MHTHTIHKNTHIQYKHINSHTFTHKYICIHTYTNTYIWWNITNTPQKTFDVLFFTKVMNCAVASFLRSLSKSKLLKSFILREIC